MKGMLIQLAAATAAKGTNRLMIGGRRCKETTNLGNQDRISEQGMCIYFIFGLLHVFCT